MKNALNILLVLLTLFYPIFIYWGLSHFKHQYLALSICLVLILRLLLAPKNSVGSRSHTLVIIVCTTLFLSLGSILFSESKLLLYNPVLINLSLCLLFLGSLRSSQPMIERFARLRHTELPEHAIHHCRQMTWLWAGFFILNGSIALYTTLLCSLATWTLYNGLISYIAIGSLFAIEFSIRLYRQRKYA